jgi:hypothetical protein
MLRSWLVPPFYFPALLIILVVHYAVSLLSGQKANKVNWLVRGGLSDSVSD